jgi:hypothetical protein
LQAICLHDGTFISVETGHTGRHHDAWVWQHSDVGSAVDVHLTADEFLLGDAGYRGIAHIFAPYEKEDLVGNPARAEFNRQLNASRSLVERQFGILQLRFSTAMEYWRHEDRQLQALAMFANALLSNRIKRVRPVE